MLRCCGDARLFQEARVCVMVNAVGVDGEMCDDGMLVPA